MIHIRCIVTLSIIAFSGLAGCASSNHLRMQGNRFDLPETLPRAAYRLSLETAGVNEIKFTGPSQRSPDIDEPELDARAGQRGLRASYALLDNLELQAETLPHLRDNLKGAPAVKAKYQFFGAPLASAQKGNISFSTTAGMVYLDEKQETTGNPSYENNITLMALDIAGIGGYRIDDVYMVYGGPFVTLVMFDGEWQGRSFTVADGSGDKYSGTASQFGANIGIAVVTDLEWTVMAEIAYTDLTWNDSNDAFTHFGVQFSKILN